MIGKTFEEMSEWRNKATEVLTNVGYTVLSPLTGEHILWPKDKIEANTFRSVPQGIGRSTFVADRARINASDILLFNFLGATEKSTGSIIEMYIGFESRKLNICVMNRSNVHRHPWITEVIGGLIFEKFNTALEYLTEIFPTSKPVERGVENDG